MAEPTLENIFGVGTTQTATTITIQKSNLDIVATTTNKAEGLAAALFKQMAVNLTQTSWSNDADRSIYIAASFDSIVSRTIGTVTTQLLQSGWNIFFTKPQTSAGITPNDY